MSENTAPAAAPAQEQIVTGASASTLYFQAIQPDVQAAAPAAEPVPDTQVAIEPSAHAEAGTPQPEKPYNAMETMQAVQTHVPHVDAGELRMAEGLISRGLQAAQKNPLTPEAIAEGHASCMNYLNSTHGPAKAERLIAAARQELAAMAQHMPGLPQILETSGYGNFPWLIERLANNHIKRQFPRGK